MPTVSPTTCAAIAAVTLLYAALRILSFRLRARGHRGAIRADLEQRKCEFDSARRRRNRLFARVQTYDIEYIDPEHDTVNAVCTVEGKKVTWSEADGVPGLFNLLVPSLPDLGQNWRG